MTASLPPPRNGDQPLERLPTSWTGYQPTGTDQVLPERRRSSRYLVQVLQVFGAGPAGFWRRSENNWGTRAAKRHPIAFQWRRTPNKKLTCTAQPGDLRQKYVGPAPPVCYGCVAGKSVQRRDCGGADGPVAEGRRGGGEFGGCVWGAAGGRFFAALRMTGSPTGNASHKPNCSDR